MRAIARILFLVLLLSPAVVAAGENGEIRLRTDAEPVSTATVDGGLSIFELLEGLGEAFDIDVVFDPRMRDSHLEIVIDDR